MLQTSEINFPLIIIIGTLTFIVLVCGLLLFVKRFQDRKNEHLLETQERESRYRQELLKAELEIQEQTLKFISQEIHDNIGQTLSLAKLNLNTIEVDPNTPASEKVVMTKSLVAKAIRDLRSISKTMNTDAIQAEGLVSAIQQELNFIERSNLFTTRLELEGEPARFDDKKELVIFRIVQEALNNSIKHSNATEIVVSVSYLNAQFNLRVVDDGDGIESDYVMNTDKGIGLINMQNRAELIGGVFTIRPNYPKGTSVEITIK